MKKLIQKATNYAKRNPGQAKKYAKKAYDSVQKQRNNSKSNTTKR